ncbi:uncharacterized protein V1510DRAFT_366550 [Dipodascopsis tothii]|uniref:uncharacterized protein n=1 Tax=Dipodascopsis tothii TaxID=44089 RepID=UPI0034CD5FC9
MRQHSYPVFYCCYVLQSLSRPGSFYIGSTPLPLRRLRQHNGELKQGAFRTRKKGARPWAMAFLVSGFPSNVAALQFEHALQHPFKTRYIAAEDRISTKTSRRTLDRTLGNVRLLVYHAAGVRRWPLTVRLFTPAASAAWTANKHAIPIPADSAVRVEHDLRPDDAPAPRVNVHVGDGCGGLRGLDTSTAPYAEYFGRAAAVDLATARCGICGGAVGPRALVCPGVGCGSVAHLTCLARVFVREDELLPTRGQCPSCRTDQPWDLMVRELLQRGQTPASASEASDESGLDSDSDGSEAESSGSRTPRRGGVAPKVAAAAVPAVAASPVAAVAVPATAASPVAAVAVPANTSTVARSKADLAAEAPALAAGRSLFTSPAPSPPASPAQHSPASLASSPIVIPDSDVGSSDW